MMAESLVSSAFLILLLPVLMAIDGSMDALSNLAVALGRHPWYTAGVFCLYLIGCYGKDYGKFWFVRHESALTAKMIALLYPYGTWFFELLLYHAFGGKDAEEMQGVPWTRASWLNLLGFSIVLVGTAGYLLASKKKSPAGAVLPIAAAWALGPRKHLRSWVT